MFRRSSREAHLSAEQTCPQAAPRFPQTHGDQKGPSSARTAAGSGPQEAFGLTGHAETAARPDASAKIALTSMKTRADFLRAQKGRRKALPGLTLETCATPAALAKAGVARVGFTASRKVGGAVERNRAKRRLRAAAASTLPLLGRERHDYVLVARTATVSRSFADLIQDLSKALSAAHGAMDQAGVASGPVATGRADTERQPVGRNRRHG